MDQEKHSFFFFFVQQNLVKLHSSATLAWQNGSSNNGRYFKYDSYSVPIYRFLQCSLSSSVPRYLAYFCVLAYLSYLACDWRAWQARPHDVFRIADSTLSWSLSSKGLPSLGDPFMYEEIKSLLAQDNPGSLI